MPGSSAMLFSILYSPIFKSQIFGCNVTFPVSSSINSLFLNAEIRLSQTFSFKISFLTPFGMVSFSNKVVRLVKPVAASVYEYIGLIVIKIAAKIWAILT